MNEKHEALDDLDRLVMLAKAADVWGEWAIWEDLGSDGFVHVGNADGVIPEGEMATPEDAEPNPIANCYTRELAEFIAAANPKVVRALVQRLQNAEVALARAKSGARTLGGILERQCEDIVKITGSEDLIDSTGDGDWGLVWERGFDLRAERDAALAREAKVRELHQPDWSDRGIDHPEEDAVCTCGYNGPYRECPTVRALDADGGADS